MITILFAMLIAGCQPGMKLRSAVPHLTGDAETVNFKISCNAPAQHQFNNALTYLHLMSYEQAEAGFHRVQELDPTCAMGYWGVAMTLFHPLDQSEPTQAELIRGWDQIDTIRDAWIVTDREKAYLEAAFAYFRDWERLSHRERIADWQKAQLAVMHKFPEDVDAVAFYGLASLAITPEMNRSYPNKARALLQKELKKYPNHPGLNNYIGAR